MRVRHVNHAAAHGNYTNAYTCDTIKELPSKQIYSHVIIIFHARLKSTSACRLPTSVRSRGFGFCGGRGKINKPSINNNVRVVIKHTSWPRLNERTWTREKSRAFRRTKGDDSWCRYATNLSNTTQWYPWYLHKCTFFEPVAIYFYYLWNIRMFVWFASRLDKIEWFRPKNQRQKFVVIGHHWAITFEYTIKKLFVIPTSRWYWNVKHNLSNNITIRY